MTTTSIIAHWRDHNTTAEGWLVIDSIKNGLTGGGVIMSAYLTQSIVENRASHMTRKLSLCSPQIGGAKGGIRFPSGDPRAPQVLSRFLQYFQGYLRDIWVFAGDFNSQQYYNHREESDSIEEIFHIQLRLNHSQYALAKNYAFSRNRPDLSSNFMKILFQSCSSRYFSFRDAASGYGMAVAVETLKSILPFKNSQNSETEKSLPSSLPRLAIYGFDETALSLAYFLEFKRIARVTSIADHTGIIFREEGLPIQQLLECSRFEEDKEGEVIQLLSSRGIWVIPDWVANIGRNQLYHLAATLQIDIMKEVLENRILEACASPIRSFLLDSYQKYSQGNYFNMYDAFVKLSDQRIRSPVSLQDCFSEFPKNHSSYPDPSNNNNKNNTHIPVLPQFTIPLRALKIGDLGDLLQSVYGTEIYNFKLLSQLQLKESPLVCGEYPPPTDRISLSMGLAIPRIVNTLLLAGCRYTIMINDSIAKIICKKYCDINHSQIQNAGEYLIQVWRAAGMQLDKVKIVWTSDLLEKNGNLFWEHLLATSVHYNYNDEVNQKNHNIDKLSKSENTGSDLPAQGNFLNIISECARYAFGMTIGADVSHYHNNNNNNNNNEIGTEHSNNSVSNTAGNKNNSSTIEINSGSILPRFRSESNTEKRQTNYYDIFVDDSPDQVKSKILSSYCPTGSEFHNELQSELAKYSNTNQISIFHENRICPILAYYRLFLNAPFHFKKNNSDLRIESFDSLKEEYIKNILEPSDIKELLVEKINEQLTPIRDHFTRNIQAKNCYNNFKKGNLNNYLIPA